MALTKISRGLLNTGVSDSSDATFLTVDSSENATFAGNLSVGGNLTVTGTTTQVNTVTMNAQNAVVFEGATADGYETTLSVVDPAGSDKTQYLINNSGYIPLLAASTQTTITSTPAELNILDGVTSTAAELNLLDGSVANTVVNSKAVVYGSSGELAGTLSTAAQTNITSLGTLTSLNVDNLTLNGSSVTSDTNLTMDVAGDITLDADGSQVFFKDDGTTRYTFNLDATPDFVMAGGNASITASTQDADFTIIGNDGGSDINALTFDMSEAGRATFNAPILAPAGSASAPSYAFGAQASTGMYKPGTNQLYFSVGGTRKMRVEASQIVLEANSSVSGTLAVSGVTTLSDHLSIPATKRLYLDGGGNTFIEETSADTMTFTTNNSERVRITGDGDVGIGCTPGSGTRLEVRDSPNSTSLVEISGTDARGLKIFTAKSNYPTDSGQNDAVVVYNAQDTENAAYPGHVFQYAGNEVLRLQQIESSGATAAVGIAVNPSFTLDVNSNGESNSMRIENSTNSRDVYVLWKNTGTGSGDDCTLNLQTAHGAGDPKIRLQVISYEHWDLMVDNSDNDAFQIKQQNDVRMHFSGGKVGIGTTSPAGVLDIPSGSYSATKPAMMLGGDIDTSGAGSRTDNTRKYSSIVGYHYSNEEEPVGILGYDCQSDSVAKVNIGIPSGNYNSPSQISFHTGASSTTASPTERMVITNDGDLILRGNTTGVDCSILLKMGTAEKWHLESDGSGSPGGHAFWIGDAQNDNGVYVAQNGSSWSGISDERLKRNWTNITNATDKIKTLTKVGTFERRGRETGNWSSDLEVGLSAQEVEAILPEAVHTGGDIEFAADDKVTGVKGLSYERLVPLLVKAVQELEEKLNIREGELEQRVHELEQRLI